MTIFYILAALLMLGIMITVHEAGHFFAARLTGIPVKEFAMGFGPKLISWKGKKHDTAFSIRAVPAGGFCAFYGEDDVQGKEVSDPRALQNAKVWKRMVTIIMGPVMNLVLAFVVCFGYYAIAEIQVADYSKAVIVSVSEGGAAEQAGLQSGDIFLMVNGENTEGINEDGSAFKVQDAINSYQPGDAPLTITVLRQGEPMDFVLTPRQDTESGKMLIGITLSAVTNPAHLTIPQAAEQSFRMCVEEGGAILSSLKTVVTSKDGMSQMSGPVGVISLIVDNTRQYGFTAYLSLLIFISVNLGLVNLLPIPGLDGSRLIFLIIEGIRRKPVPQKVEAYIHAAGFLLLMVLFFFLTFQDIGRLF